jgi:hypothetical protein
MPYTRTRNPLASDPCYRAALRTLESGARLVLSDANRSANAALRGLSRARPIVIARIGDLTVAFLAGR